MYGYCRPVKSKHGLCSQEASPFEYELPERPPIIQHFAPLAAAVITVFDGVPHAQSEPNPPGTHAPLVASKPSLYGKTEMGVPHCACIFCVKQNVQMSKKNIPVVLCKSNRKLII